MKKYTTRGRGSKIDHLPPEIKTQLAVMLRDKQYSQAQILAEINELIRECGLEESYKLSRTGLNRYASRMEKVAGRIRDAREVAEVWTQKLGEAPKGDIGKMLIEIIKQIAFDKLLDTNNANIEPKHLKDFAMIIQRLEQADSLNAKREQLIKEEALKTASLAVEKAAKAQGLGQDAVLKMVQAVYGIGE